MLRRSQWFYDEKRSVRSEKVLADNPIGHINRCEQILASTARSVKANFVFIYQDSGPEVRNAIAGGDELWWN